MSRDDRLPGDMPMTPPPSAGPVHPQVAEEVVATYVADAVRIVPGIVQLRGSAWQELSKKMRAEVPTKGIVVRTVGPRAIEVDIHVRVAWGVVIPDLAREVQEVVARKVEALLDLDVQKATLYVDEIEGPVSAAARSE